MDRLRRIRTELLGFAGFLLLTGLVANGIVYGCEIYLTGVVCPEIFGKKFTDQCVFSRTARRIATDVEQERMAAHEAGHAIALPPEHPPQRLVIRTRLRADVNAQVGGWTDVAQDQISVPREKAWPFIVKTEAGKMGELAFTENRQPLFMDDDTRENIRLVAAYLELDPRVVGDSTCEEFDRPLDPDRQLIVRTIWKARREAYDLLQRHWYVGIGLVSALTDRPERFGAKVIQREQIEKIFTWHSERLAVGNAAFDQTFGPLIDHSLCEVSLTP